MCVGYADERTRRFVSWVGVVCLGLALETDLSVRVCLTLEESSRRPFGEHITLWTGPDKYTGIDVRMYMCECILLQFMHIAYPHI